jgi:hypothetical protein
MREGDVDSRDGVVRGEAAAESAYQFLSLMALPAEALLAQLLPYRHAPWTVFGEGSLLQVLADAYDDNIGGVLRQPEWFDIVDRDGIFREIRAYLDLFREIVVSSAHQARLLDNIEALCREPEWRLLSVLARELLKVLGLEPWRGSFDVPTLLAGGSGAASAGLVGK